MGRINKLKDTMKEVPFYIWIAGLIVPGGMIAIGLYTAYKASRKRKKEQTLNEFMDQVLKEGKDD